MTGWTKHARATILLLIAAAILGLGMAAAEKGGFRGDSFSAYGSLAAILLLGGWLIWRGSGAERRLGWLALVAFLLRLGLGIGLGLLLPVVGYDTETQNAGYLFYDAFQRDGQAWELAQSGDPLTIAFGEEFSSDQYGGMLFLSAGLYSLFSPELHRPWLIILVAAFAMSVGVLFVYRALNSHFGRKTAWLAACIFAFYPEGILLGAAQMRDPLLIGLSAIAFYLVESWRVAGWKNFLWFVVVMTLLVAFSWPAALAVGVILVLWWWIDYSATLADRRRRLMGWAFLGLLGIVGFTWQTDWLRSMAAWDIDQAIRSSGWLDALFKELPAQFQVPFIVIYGLLQPVLPAALFDPSIPIWTGITTFKSLGWYLILPVLLYTPIGLLKAQPGLTRRLLVASVCMVAAWSVISSLRAGGDVWDNPRYRTLLLPWIALVVAWAWNFAREQRDGWLVRWYAVIGIFLLFFTNWYLYRIYNRGILIEFWTMIGLIVGLSLLVLGWGIYTEIKAHARSSPPSG